jgi:hypothetical protein
MPKKVYIVYQTYGEGEFDIQKIFYDEEKAKALVKELTIKGQADSDEWHIHNNVRCVDGSLPIYHNYGYEEYEIEDA